jgi:hypothetical protein
VGVPVWPRTGQRVDVELVSSRERMVAVVDDARPPEQLHVREPVTPEGGPIGRVPLGAHLRMWWTTPAGLHELAVVLDGLPHNRIQLWRLVPLMTPVVDQRRNYLRAPDALDATLGRGPDEWVGTVVDISEGGARCVVEEPGDLRSGDVVRLAVEIDSQPLSVQAEVLSIEMMDAPLDEVQRATVRMRFEALGRAADVVRRRVLEQERRARALAREGQRA